MLTGKPFTLEIVTPQGIAFTGKVESVTLPGVVDPFQVLYNHAPIISDLAVGIIKCNDSSNNTTFFACGGGFVQVFHNTVSVVVESAERATEINKDRALAAKQRAEQRLRNLKPDTDVLRAELALQRALVRLKVSSYH